MMMTRVLQRMQGLFKGNPDALAQRSPGHNVLGDRGENVAAGMYLVVIEATQSGERRQLRGKLMVIR